jgi:hypothetical protein
MQGHLRLLSALALWLGTTAFACSHVSDYVHCHKVCDRYQECNNSSFDVNGCSSRCEKVAQKDKAYSRTVNECNACLETRACGESQACWAQCPDMTKIASSQ